MKVALVGPTHPAKGGVAAHTTALAHRLEAEGHHVTLVTWSHLYPSALYPGQSSVPDGEPDLTPFPRTVHALSWARPDSWVRTGRRLHAFDAVVIVHVVPAVVPAHLALIAAARAGSGPSPRVVVLAHNVLPHEVHLGARPLVSALLCRVDAALVHTLSEQRSARELGAREVGVAPLPPHLPGGPAVPRRPYDGPTRLLALGMVRHYKGVDLVEKALLQVPDVTLTVAGELWGDAGRSVQVMAASPRLRGRVHVEPGYVPAGRLAALCAEHDVLTLTYRSATASQNVLLAHAQGLPVLATDVGPFAAQIEDGVDGLVVPPGDEPALVAAVSRLADRRFVESLRAGVCPPDLDQPWIPYLKTLEHLMTEQAEPTAPNDGQSERSDPAGQASGQVAAPPGGAALALAKRAAEYALWARVRVQRRLEDAVPALAPPPATGVPVESHHTGRPLRRPIPVTVPPTGVLQDRAQWESAVGEARRLRLPLHRDKPKNWDALGAVGALLRLAGEERAAALAGEPGGGRSIRDLRVMDAGSARYSPVLPWLRLFGLGDAPESLLGINLEFGEPVRRDGVTFRYGDVTDTGLPDGSLDAVTCMSVIEHGVPVRPFLAESARVLRPGGVLCVSTDFDQDPPDTSRHTAYGGPVHIFSPAEIRTMVEQARDLGLDLVTGPSGADLSAPATLAHRERPVHWQRLGLDYTFILLTFRRR